ncbi:hypothetical protein [Burkholderia pseudomallei]|uniref:hypothetical protein n=1 Tax=Burkholderia pseudomallei TaxID=28450 RepID=UPI0024688921|nr:hypothetical protein [Burkholderia pseudomallei]
MSRCFWWRASRAVGQFAGVPIGVAVRENFNRNFARKIDRKLVVQPRAWSHVLPEILRNNSRQFCAENFAMIAAAYP